MTRILSTLGILHKEQENRKGMRKLLTVMVAEKYATIRMNVRNLLRTKGGPNSTENQEEERPPLFG